MWEQWKRTTRLISSTRLALTRERQLWQTLEIEHPSAVSLRAQLGTSDYQIGLEAHLDALDDEHTFCAMALLFSYAIAENSVAEKLGKKTDDLGQVEKWGQEILDSASRSWTDVMDGKEGIVEVCIYRNAIAHGSVRFEPRHVNRLTSFSNITPAWKAGDPIAMNYDLLKMFRARLKSLLRKGEVEQLTAQELGELQR